LVLVVDQGQGEAAKAALADVGAAAVVEGLDENVVARLEENPAPIATAPADEPLGCDINAMNQTKQFQEVPC
jgi:hypothetical protein